MTKNNTTPKIELGPTSSDSCKIVDIVNGIRNIVPAKLLADFDNAIATAATDDYADAWDIYDEIFDTMNEMAPDGMYWGASKYDGNCMGFWDIY